MNKHWQSRASVCLMGLVGCGQSGGTDYVEQLEDVSSVSSELSQACANANPVATGSGSLNVTSTRSYNPGDCFKGYVVQVNDLAASSMGGTGGSVGSGGAAGGPLPIPGAVVAWGDAAPTTREACEAAWVGSYLFAEQADGSFATQSLITTRGVWVGVCQVPHGYFMRNEMPLGGTYKFAASARTAQTAGAATRRVHVETF